MSLSPEARQRIQSLVNDNSVLLFMKGNRQQPQCGFSSQVVGMLDQLLGDYATVDVLSDDVIRQGIKEFSDWPTIPQLYSKGEFLGGCDIITEMFEQGELHTALGVEKPELVTPEIAVSDDARDLILDLQRNSHEASGDLHLRVDGSFQSSLGFGPEQPGLIEVVSNGLHIWLDIASASRAQGMRIDAVDTPEGKRLAVENPNAPRG